MLKDSFETVPYSVVAAPFGDLSAAESMHAIGVHCAATNAGRQVGRGIDVQEELLFEGDGEKVVGSTVWLVAVWKEN